MIRTLALAALAAAILASTASASTVTDPRKCSYGPAQQAHCARDAAKLVARRYLQARVHAAVIWQGPMTCTGAGSLLRWRCSFTSSYPTDMLPNVGNVLVVYRATTTGWKVVAVLTP